ncbi:hypothetical protein NliqN6_4457 [Naganishia liquefaciens]|uniref:Uncharacterized protein n=1 Tax=Naganishia liquefaciens TaxID=104408 RepID=A0A8H3TVL7_9TREE|nr:hypothetical protein NliqN6_4457 [Naganishia liquefaciens]
MKAQVESIFTQYHSLLLQMARRANEKFDCRGNVSNLRDVMSLTFVLNDAGTGTSHGKSSRQHNQRDGTNGSIDDHLSRTYEASDFSNSTFAVAPEDPALSEDTFRTNTLQSSMVTVANSVDLSRELPTADTVSITKKSSSNSCSQLTEETKGTVAHDSIGLLGVDLQYQMIVDFIETLQRSPTCFKVEKPGCHEDSIDKTDWILGFENLRIHLGDYELTASLHKTFDRVDKSEKYFEKYGTRAGSFVQVRRTTPLEFVQAHISPYQTYAMGKEVQSVLDILSRLREYPVGYYRVHESLPDGERSQFGYMEPSDTGR